MTNPARQIQLENTLRLISAATSDQAVKALALDVLGESSLRGKDMNTRTSIQCPSCGKSMTAADEAGNTLLQGPARRGMSDSVLTCPHCGIESKPMAAFSMPPEFRLTEAEFQSIKPQSGQEEVRALSPSHFSDNQDDSEPPARIAVQQFNSPE